MTTTLDIRDFAAANPKLVQRRESIRYPGLFVLKYSKRVFFDNLWTEELEHCRGLIVDAEWNIVVQPFKKIYNRFERDTNFPLDKKVTAYKKINGFMAVVTYVPGRDSLIVSTTGSLDSEFADMAREQLFKNKSEQQWLEVAKRLQFPHTSFMFEVVHPADPHIVQEEVGAYALALRVRYDEPDYALAPKDLEFSLFFGGVADSICEDFGVFNVPSIEGTFADVVKLAAEAQHEGYVVYGPGDHDALKIKSPYYLVTKFFARKSEAKLETLLNGDSWKQIIDEEYYDLVHFLRTIREDFIAMDEQVRISVVRKWFENKLKG